MRLLVLEDDAHLSESSSTCFRGALRIELVRGEGYIVRADEEGAPDSPTFGSSTAGSRGPAAAVPPRAAEQPISWLPPTPSGPSGALAPGSRRRRAARVRVPP